MTRPAAVRIFEHALADWLSSFTMPEALGSEMVDACAEGASWAAAIAGVAARRAGWSDTEAMAWGLCVGGLAGALEATRRSLSADGGGAASPARATEATPPVGTASGPALPLLAADGLIAAAHETLGSLEPAHARAALAALAQAFADGGPWRAFPTEVPGRTVPAAPAWPAVVACGLGPAIKAEPEGPWADWAEAWKARYGGVHAPGELASEDARELWEAPRAEADVKALLRAAAREAGGRAGRADETAEDRDAGG